MKAVHASHIKTTHQSLILTFLTLTHTLTETHRQSSQPTVSLRDVGSSVVITHCGKSAATDSNQSE